MQQDQEDADRFCMEELQQGRDSGLSELMRRHQERLLRFVFRFIQNEADARDVTQETFVKIYHNRHKFDRNRLFSTWMYQIASNLVKDRFRWKSRHHETALPSDLDSHGSAQEFVDRKDSPATEAIKKESARAVAKAIAELAPDLQIPLVLSQYEGRSHCEIAEIIGCSSKAVETRIYRAKQQLRKSLAVYLEVGPTQSH